MKKHILLITFLLGISITYAEKGILSEILKEKSSQEEINSTPIEKIQLAIEEKTVDFAKLNFDRFIGNYKKNKVFCSNEKPAVLKLIPESKKRTPLIKIFSITKKKEGEPFNNIENYIANEGFLYNPKDIEKVVEIKSPIFDQFKKSKFVLLDPIYKTGIIISDEIYNATLGSQTGAPVSKTFGTVKVGIVKIPSFADNSMRLGGPGKEGTFGIYVHLKPILPVPEDVVIQAMPLIRLEENEYSGIGKYENQILIYEPKNKIAYVQGSNEVPFYVKVIAREYRLGDKSIEGAVGLRFSGRPDNLTYYLVKTTGDSTPKIKKVKQKVVVQVKKIEKPKLTSNEYEGLGKYKDKIILYNEKNKTATIKNSNDKPFEVRKIVTRPIKNGGIAPKNPVARKTSVLLGAPTYYLVKLLSDNEEEFIGLDKYEGKIIIYNPKYNKAYIKGKKAVPFHVEKITTRAIWNRDTKPQNPIARKSSGLFGLTNSYLIESKPKIKTTDKDYLIEYKGMNNLNGKVVLFNIKTGMASIKNEESKPFKVKPIKIFRRLGGGIPPKNPIAQRFNPKTSEIFYLTIKPEARVGQGYEILGSKAMYVPSKTFFIGSKIYPNGKTIHVKLIPIAAGLNPKYYLKPNIIHAPERIINKIPGGPSGYYKIIQIK